MFFFLQSIQTQKLASDFHEKKKSHPILEDDSQKDFSKFNNTHKKFGPKLQDDPIDWNKDQIIPESEKSFNSESVDINNSRAFSAYRNFSLSLQLKDILK